MIIVTTSDRYHHILPVFFYLYGKYWNEPFTLLGYAKPLCELPENCTWHSMGEQKGVNDWSTGIRDYIASSTEQWFTWLMEDTVLKAPVKLPWLPFGMKRVGRINLTNDVSKREHNRTDDILYADPNSRYRLSTQPSIWNREYLLQYLKPGLSPWIFETQDPMCDGWHIIGLVDYPVVHCEGVTRRNIYKLNTDGMSPEDIAHIKTIAEWLK